MILTRIRCAGFRGIRESLDLKIPEGFLVLTGRNGAGKSSVCDAVEFALTGAIRRHADGSERQERIADYVWWRGEGSPAEPFVSLVFQSEGSRELTVTRTPRGLQAPASEDEIVQALCVPGQAPSDPMTRLLGTAIIRDEEITQLSIDLPERERFKFVRAAIGETELPSYIDRLNKAHTQVENLRKQRVEEYESVRTKVNDLVAQIAEAETHLSDAEDLSAAEESLRRYIGDISEEGSLLRSARAKVVELRSSADRLRELADELEELETRTSKEALEKHEEIASDLAADVAVKEEALKDSSHELERIEAKLEQASTEGGDLKNWAEVLELGEGVGLKEGHCPLCGSEVEEAEFADHINRTRAHLKQRNDVLATLVSQRLSIRKSHDTLDAELQELRARLERHQRSTAKAREQMEVVLSRAEEFNLEGEEITSSVFRSAGEHRRDEARRIERWAMLLETSAEVDDVEMLQDHLNEAREEQARLENSVAKADRAEERAKNAYDAVRRIEREVIDERLAALGPVLEELYLRLKPHLDWTSVRYRLRGDVQHYLSLEVGDDLNPRFMFSSGQRRAMGIAFLLAAYFSSSWARFRTLILDDPVQHIDDFRALHLAEVLNGVRKQGRQVICAAEDPELARLIARRLRGIRGEAGALVELAYEPGVGVGVERYEVMGPIPQRVLKSAS